MAKYLLPSICDNLVWLYSIGILVWQSPPWSEWEEVQRSAHCKSNLPMRSERPSTQNYTKLIKTLSHAFLFTSVPSDLNKKVWFSPKVNLYSSFPTFLITFRCKQLLDENNKDEAEFSLPCLSWEPLVHKIAQNFITFRCQQLLEANKKDEPEFFLPCLSCEPPRGGCFSQCWSRNEVW